MSEEFLFFAALEDIGFLKFLSLKFKHMSFEFALKFTLQWEGGYVNHPADPGGETNFGVTNAVYVQYRRSKGKLSQSVKLISKAEVYEIYYSNYWVRAGCEALPSKLALCHFDWAVNHGVNGAIKTLQRITGADPDGIFGPATKNAVNSAVKTKGELAMCKAYCDERDRCYRRWGVGKKQVFLKGWLNRLNALRNYVA